VKRAQHLADGPVSCGTPLQEDWGWTLPVEVARSKFFVTPGLMDELSETPTWVAWVQSRGVLSGQPPDPRLQRTDSRPPLSRQPSGCPMEIGTLT
jgi:hypothetical protein